MVLAAGAGCASLGRDFSDQTAAKIVIGQTTRAQIEQQLGEPFRKGLDSGDPSVTYLYYQMGLFAAPRSKDLVITYDRNGVVKSYTYNQSVEPNREADDLDLPGPKDESK